MVQKDIYYAAGLLLRRHGDGAIIHAMNRVLEMREAGNKRGAAVWLNLFEAVLDLHAAKPAKADTIH